MRRRRPVDDLDGFAAFVDRVKPALTQALVATYGPVDGREATVDALSWAWEHRDRLAEIDHPVAYLYRVGQTATRRFLPRALPAGLTRRIETEFPDVEPGLLPALARLTDQQRTVVVLVYGYSWRQAEVAELLNINASTVHRHLERAIENLRDTLNSATFHRDQLEVTDVSHNP